jgi:periplasmic mercuric ion binding protein
VKSLVLLPLLFVFAGPAWAAERVVIFSVPGMTCALCPITIKTAMEGVNGVKFAEADLETKTAKATYEDTVVMPEAIAKASANSGYPATVVSIQ